MKYFFSVALIYFLTIFSSNVLAQKLELKDASLIYNDIERQCIRVVFEPGTEATKSYFKDWMDAEYEVKMKGYGFLTNKEVLSGEKILLPGVSDKKLDFYAKIVQVGEYTELSVFASPGYNIHINRTETPQNYQAMKALVLDFLDAFLPAWYSGQIEENKNTLTDLEKERNKLEKGIENNQEEIEDLREEIGDMDTELEQTNRELVLSERKLKRREEKLKAANKKLEKLKQKKN